MNEISTDDLKLLKTLYNAYTKHPRGTKEHEAKWQEYCKALNFLCGKYHTEPYQLTILSGIE